ncbi:MAG: DegT/DnrJ/EryC1/StrS family aminotransferase [Ktedonobacteraceae bacterium]|nr:DegT/DnrJ/EryC1/StrS family aminotransferase [Ktedonobacteraceae bacterium]
MRSRFAVRIGPLAHLLERKEWYVCSALQSTKHTTLSHYERQKARKDEEALSLKIPLVDLQAQYSGLKPAILAALEAVLDSMQLFLGPQIRAFEHNFAAYCQCQYGIGVSSGTDALAIALRACDIGPGDEVITVANTFIATVEAIALVGAKPVFVDVDPETYLLDWRQLEQALSSRTRAVLPVHLYGHAAEMLPIMNFARAHGLHVIEDASQAHGATYQGRRVGSFGDVGCFSLYYSKNLGAFGEAGICTTNDEALAEKIRMIRDHGSRIRYRHEVMGVNARLDEMQAAVLNVKMPHLDQWNTARQAHAQAYTEQLRDVVEAVPVVRPWGTHVYCYYVIQVTERDALREALQQEGIGTNIHYPTPIHLQPACASYGYTDGMLPVTESVSQHIVSLPMYPELTAEQIHYVVSAVKKYSLLQRRVRSYDTGREAQWV